MSDHKFRILLVYILGPFDVERNGEEYPLGLGYIKSSLRANGYDCDILCKSMEQEDEIISFASSISFDMVGFSCNMFNMSSVNRIVPVIKGLRNVPIIAGGPEAWSMYKDMLQLNPSIDAVIRGDGEHSFVQLCKDWFQNGEFTVAIPGVSYQRLHGQTLISDHVCRVEDLDALSFPDNYYDDNKIVGIDEVEWDAVHYQMNTSRGCAMGCNFCFWTNLGIHIKRYRRSTESCINELVQFLESRVTSRKLYYIYLILTDDHTDVRLLTDLLTHVRERFQEYGFQIHCYTQTSILDVIRLGPEGVRNLKELGVINAFIGLESFSTPMLQRYRKPYATDKAVMAVNIIREAGALDICNWGFISVDPLTTIDELKDHLKIIFDNEMCGVIPLDKMFRSRLFQSINHQFDGYNKPGDWRNMPLDEYFSDHRVKDVYVTMCKLVDMYYEKKIIKPDLNHYTVDDAWTHRAFQLFATLLYDDASIPTDQRFQEFVMEYQNEM